MVARAINTSRSSRPHVSRASPYVLAWGRRILGYLVLLGDTFAEAQELARTAQRHYPFVDW